MYNILYIYILLIVNPYLKYFGRCLLQYLYKCHSIHRTRNPMYVLYIHLYLCISIYLSLYIILLKKVFNTVSKIQSLKRFLQLYMYVMYANI